MPNRPPSFATLAFMLLAGTAFAADRDALIAEFDASTAPLVRQSKAIEHGWDDKAFRNGLERHNGDATALLREGWVSRFLQDANAQQQLARQYRAHLGSMIAAMPAGSHCKSQAPLTQMDTELAAIDAYIQRLQGYQGLSSLEQAYPAVMDMNISHARVVSVISLGATFRHCVLLDEAPALARGLSGEEGDALAINLISTLAAEDVSALMAEAAQGDNAEVLAALMAAQAGQMPADDKTNASIAKPSIAQPLIAKPLTAGPDTAGQSTQGTDNNTVADNTVADAPQAPSGSAASPQPVSAVTFTDAALGGCIKEAARSMSVTMTDELELLQCDLNGKSVKLADLRQFPALSMLALSNAHIDDLTPLSGIDNLILSNVTLAGFKGLRDVSSMQLANADVSDWLSLTALKGTTVSIKSGNCDDLAALDGRDDLVLIHKGLDSRELAGRMARSEQSGVATVMTRCSFGAAKLAELPGGTKR